MRSVCKNLHHFNFQFRSRLLHLRHVRYGSSHSSLHVKSKDYPKFTDEMLKTYDEFSDMFKTREQGDVSWLDPDKPEYSQIHERMNLGWDDWFREVFRNEYKRVEMIKLFHWFDKKNAEGVPRLAVRPEVKVTEEFARRNMNVEPPPEYENPKYRKFIPDVVNNGQVLSAWLTASELTDDEMAQMTMDRMKALEKHMGDSNNFMRGVDIKVKADFEEYIKDIGTWQDPRVWIRRFFVRGETKTQRLKRRAHEVVKARRDKNRYEDIFSIPLIKAEYGLEGIPIQLQSNSTHEAGLHGETKERCDRKIQMTVQGAQLGLGDEELNTLAELCPEYQDGVLTLSCEDFPTASQNERRVLEWLGGLIREAKRLATISVDTTLSFEEYEKMFSADNWEEQKIQEERMADAEEQTRRAGRRAEQILSQQRPKRRPEERSAVLTGLARRFADSIPVMSSKDIQDWIEKIQHDDVPFDEGEHQILRILLHTALQERAFAPSPEKQDLAQIVAKHKSDDPIEALPASVKSRFDSETDYDKLINDQCDLQPFTEQMKPNNLKKIRSQNSTSGRREVFQRHPWQHAEYYLDSGTFVTKRVREPDFVDSEYTTRAIRGIQEFDKDWEDSNAEFENIALHRGTGIAPWDDIEDNTEEQKRLKREYKKQKMLEENE